MDSRKKFKYRGNTCLNCSTSLDKSERYCPFCGQLNSTKKLTIKDFLEEFLSNFYAYDSRLRNSIVSIFTKPGVLAKEFNEGKRQKYANPFRLFLSVSIVLFITINLENKEFNTKLNDERTTSKNDSISNIHYNLGNKKDTIQLSFNSYHKDSIYSEEELNKNGNGVFYRMSTFKNFHTKNLQKTTEASLKELKFKNNFLNRFLYNKARYLKTNDVNNEIKNYFFQKLPFLIFLSLPIFTIMFWMLYFRKKMNYTEHLVFTYTFFTFMFISVLIFNFINLINPNLEEILSFIIFVFIFPIYFYKSLRNFYQQSRWKTILKFIILNPLFGVFLIISFILMIFLGIILF